MKKKMAVIIPVETKSREFHGKLWLALHLLHAGHPVLFGSQARLWNYADLVDPAIYLDKSVAATRTDWFRRCRAMGHEVVSWDEEGLVFFDAWLYRKQRIAPASFDQVSRFYAWGEVQREAICEEYPQYRDTIALCGNPRFDFLRPELRAFYRETVDALRNQYGPMLLINTNFSFYNHFRSADEIRALMARYPINDEPGYMDRWIDMHREMFEFFCAMIPELLQRFPQHNVVLRPHPSESHAPYEALAKKHPRLHVESTGNVHAWILAAEALVHCNCTTAVEAYLAGVPPFAYRPKRYPKYENELPNALSVNTFTKEELFSALEERATVRERGVLWTAEQGAVAKRYMMGLDGDTAAGRVSAEITSLASALPRRSFTLSRRLLAEAKRAWRIRLHARREAQQPSDGYSEQKFPGLDAGEISETLDRMVGLSGLRVDYSVRQFAKHCFWISP